MLTVTVPRSNVSVDEVSTALRDKLGSRYHVEAATKSVGFTREVPADDNTMLVKGGWFKRANVKIVPGTGSTEIQVSPGATYFGLIRLIDQMLVTRKVHRALADAPGLAQSS
ncbi:MAG TPA: hypothetical protein VH637_13810 [Streptosporangiaceae bacterium]|jgi:hypothetical protein